MNKTLSTNHESQDNSYHELSLAEASSYLLEECRMVLPGIQAIFGFQLIATFQQTFLTRLSHFDQVLHFIAIAFIILAIILVMSPAAYHRLSCPKGVTKKFIRYSNRFLLFSMISLSFGLSIDFYMISELIFGSHLVSLILSLVLLFFCFFFWFLFSKIFH